MGNIPRFPDFRVQVFLRLHRIRVETYIGYGMYYELKQHVFQDGNAGSKGDY